MPLLTVTKTYLNGNTLTEGDLDNIKNSIETFFNVTKIANDNIQSSGVSTANLAANAVDESKLATSVAGDGLAGGGGTPLSVNVDGTAIVITSDVVTLKTNAAIPGTPVIAGAVRIGGGSGPTITASGANLQLSGGLLLNGGTGTNTISFNTGTLTFSINGSLGLLADLLLSGGNSGLRGQSDGKSVSALNGGSGDVYPLVMMSKNVSTANSFAIVRGNVAANGTTVNNGEAFSGSHGGTTGAYSISFNNTFTTAPAVTITAIGGTFCMQNQLNITPSGFSFNMIKADATLVDAQYSFIAIGPI